MDLTLNQTDKIRVGTGTPPNKNGVFVDVKHEEKGNVYPFVSIQAHRFHQYFVVQKKESVCIFVFKKDDKVDKSLFGWWSDGEIVCSNSKIYNHG